MCGKENDDMSTVIRPELSINNPYWIERHRYYELKHFCLQYPIWKKIHSSIGGLSATSVNATLNQKTYFLDDLTGKHATMRAYYSHRMRMLENVAYSTDPLIGKYILEGVTKGVSYDVLKARLEIPCSKDKYYELYRKFFWLLDRERQ